MKHGIKGAGVYFLLSPTVGLTKIGYAKNLTMRIASYRTDNAEELEIVAIVHTAHLRTAERWFHWRFAKERVRYEWFRISKADIEEAIATWNRF